MPPAIRLTVSLILQRLSASGACFPQLVDATAHMVDGCLRDADFIFELIPGVTLLANFHSLFQRPGSDGERAAADRLCRQAREACGHAFQLKPVLDRVSSCAKTLVENARRRGLPVDLVSAHVGEYGPWHELDDARFRVTIETLGQNLRRCRMPLIVGTEDELRVMFASVMDGLEERVAERDRLRGLNADGIVDLLTLNAMIHLGHPMATLRAMLDRNRMNLTNGVELVWQDGEIRSRIKQGGSIEWTAGCLTLTDLALPEMASVNAIGRPVTDLVSHFALTSDIQIRSVTNHSDGATKSIRVELDSPVFLFNVELGLIWLGG